MEGLGTSFIEVCNGSYSICSNFTWVYHRIPIFFFGDWQYGLITGAIIWTLVEQYF